MFVKQISVFVENKKGKLSKIIGILSENQIDIRALSVADTTDFGILRLIVNDPKKAYQVLKEAGCTVSETDVLAVEVDDRPGGLSYLLGLMADNNLSVEYMYAFVSKIKNKAYVILKASEPKETQKIFAANHISILSENDIYAI